MKLPKFSRSLVKVSEKCPRYLNRAMMSLKSNPESLAFQMYFKFFLPRHRIPQLLQQ